VNVHIENLIALIKCHKSNQLVLNPKEMYINLVCFLSTFKS